MARGARPPQDWPGAAPPANWLADLDQAINFDLDAATDHALRQSTEEGRTHAGWTRRTPGGSTAPGASHDARIDEPQRLSSTVSGAHVQTTMRNGATPIAAVHTTDELKLTRHRDNGDYDGDGVEDALDVSIHPVCVGDVDISSGGPCPDALCLSGCAVVTMDVPSPYGVARRVRMAVR